MHRAGRQITSLAGLILAVGVIIGAFGAHALRETLETHGGKDTFDLGVLYFYVHGLGMLLVGAITGREERPSRGYWASAGLMLGGIVCFSGSLFYLGATGSRALVLITPLGGLMFVAAWIVLAWTVFRGGAKKRPSKGPM